MKKLTLTTIKYGVAAIFVALVFSQANLTAQEGVSPSLEGVWEVTTTPRNCATGEPVPTAAFSALYTFHKDGTMISWYSSGTQAAGLGLWRRDGGRTDYSFKLRRLLRSATTPPVFSGTQEIGGTLTLNERGDQYTSDEYMIVYSIEGVPGTRGCINSVGTRFVLD